MRTLSARRRRAPAGSTAPELLSKIEHVVVGLARLISGVLRVIWRLLSSPLGFHAHVTKDRSSGKAAPPYTFLTLSTFLAIKAIRTLLLGVFLLFAAFQRSCSLETQQDTAPLKVADQLKIPSIEEILTIGVPSVLLILLVLFLVKRLLTRGAESDRAEDRFYELSCYVVGFQYLLVIAAVAFLLPYFFTPEGQAIAISEDFSQYSFFAFAALAVLWPAFLFAVQLPNMIPYERNRLGRGKWFFRISNALVALVLSTLTIAAGVVVSYPMARMDAADHEGDKPVAEVALLDHAPAPDGSRELTLLVTNKTPKPLLLWPRALQVQWRDGSGLADPVFGRMASWKDGGAKVLALAPGETAWVTAVLTGPTPTAGAACPAASTMFRAVLPERAAGLACFMSLTSSGDARWIYATVKPTQLAR